MHFSLQMNCLLMDIWIPETKMKFNIGMLDLLYVTRRKGDKIMEMFSK